MFVGFHLDIALVNVVSSILQYQKVKGHIFGDIVEWLGILAVVFVSLLNQIAIHSELNRPR